MIIDFPKFDESTIIYDGNHFPLKLIMQDNSGREWHDVSGKQLFYHKFASAISAF